MLTRVVGSRRYFVMRASVHISDKIPNALFESRVCIFYEQWPRCWLVGFVFPANVTIVKDMVPDEYAQYYCPWCVGACDYTCLK